MIYEKEKGTYLPVKTEVDGLPQENFWSKEKTDEVNHDVIRRHYWGWKYLKNIKYPD